MFIRNPQDKPHQLDETIDMLIVAVNESVVGEENHTAAVQSLKELMEARNADRAATKRPSVSPDTIASIAANLLAVGLILTYEKANVITTKSWPLVPKTKI